MDQVYEIETVRKKCLDLLRAEGRTLTAGEICMALQLPHWAVQAGLDSARLAGLARFTGGAGWGLATESQAPQLDHEQRGLL